MSAAAAQPFRVYKLPVPLETYQNPAITWQFLRFFSNGRVQWRVNGQRWRKSYRQRSFQSMEASGRAMYLAALELDEKWEVVS